ncbi:MAG: hypothetical protein H6R18_416 [Proteobacteria bacterium]|nr:hypothetical protein [Pseudomonadota bacterium]
MIGLNTAQALNILTAQNNAYKMDELGGQAVIVVDRHNLITHAEAMTPPLGGQRKPSAPDRSGVNILQKLFKLVDKTFSGWCSKGKLSRAQEDIESHLGKISGKLYNLNRLQGKEGGAVVRARAELLSDISSEIDKFNGEINMVANSYGIPRAEAEEIFINRLINSLHDSNPQALNHIKAALRPIVDMPVDAHNDADANPLMRDHAGFATKFKELITAKVPDEVIAQPIVPRSPLQRLEDTVLGIFGSKEQRLKLELRGKLNTLEALCTTHGPELQDIASGIQNLRSKLSDTTSLSMDQFDAIQHDVNSIIAQTIHLGKDIATKALAAETAAQIHQQVPNKYTPQLVNAEVANKKLYELLDSKGKTLDAIESGRSELDKDIKATIEKSLTDSTKSTSGVKGAKAVAQQAVNSVNDMTRKFVAVQNELNGLRTEIEAINLANILKEKRDTPPAGVDGGEWKKACLVIARHLADEFKVKVKEEDLPSLQLIQANKAHFTQGLGNAAEQKITNLFSRIDASRSFVFKVPAFTQSDIEALKERNISLMQEKIAPVNNKLMAYVSFSEKLDTGNQTLNARLRELKESAPFEQMDLGTIHDTKEKVENLIASIKDAYAYEIADTLSSIDNSKNREISKNKLFESFQKEISLLTEIKSDLTGLLNMNEIESHVEQLNSLKCYCPEGTNAEEWANDCNAIIDHLLKNNNAQPDSELKGTLYALLDKFNTSLIGAHDQDPRVKLNADICGGLKTNWDFDISSDMDPSVLGTADATLELCTEVNKMTSARIQTADLVTLFGDSAIAITQAGLPNADDIRACVAEFANKMTDYTDTLARGGAGVDLKQREAKESLSKTIHAFNNVMFALADKERKLEIAEQTGSKYFSKENIKAMTNLKSTMLNAYQTLFNIGQNAMTLDNRVNVSLYLENKPADLVVKAMQNNDALEITSQLKSLYNRKTETDNPEAVKENNKKDIAIATKQADFRLTTNSEKHFVKLYKQTSNLAAELVKAEENGLDKTVSQDIKKIFGNNSFKISTGLDLSGLIPDQKEFDKFENDFASLHGALGTMIATTTAFALNVHAIENKVSIEAEGFLRKHGPREMRNDSTKVLSLHALNSTMTKIFIATKANPGGKWYAVNKQGEGITFTHSEKSKLVTSPFPAEVKETAFPYTF